MSASGRYADLPTTGTTVATPLQAWVQAGDTADASMTCNYHSAIERWVADFDWTHAQDTVVP